MWNICQILKSKSLRLEERQKKYISQTKHWSSLMALKKKVLKVIRFVHVYENKNHSLLLKKQKAFFIYYFF